jgi:sterol 3beta-glucosyltransferase
VKILVLAHGTRGDVQPYAALALALRQAGHEPLLAAPAASAGLVAPYGLPFAGVHDGPNTLIDDPRVREAIETNYRGVRGKRIALEVMRRSKPLMARVLTDMVAAAGLAHDGAGATGREGRPDLVVHAPGIPGHRIAEALGVPAVPAVLQPVWVPTPTFRNPMLPVPLPRALNRASYRSTALLLRSFGGIADAALELPRRRGRHDVLRRPDGSPATVLQGFSRHLLPPGTAYPSWVHTTGFWYLPAPPSWSPPPELTAFLEAGEPPVYIGFGSMAGTDPARVGAVVTEAVRRAGVRAVLVSGWGGMQVDGAPRALGGDVLLLDQVPHAWLFPRVAAVVHHGGSGTAGAALAAGRPQVVCPFVADQPFWAARAHATGVAPAPLPQRRLSADRLAAAIRCAIGDRTMLATAERLGAQVHAEDGARAAVRVLESVGVG